MNQLVMYMTTGAKGPRVIYRYILTQGAKGPREVKLIGEAFWKSKGLAAKNDLNS